MAESITTFDTNDHTDTASCVAFAMAGWYDDWNLINGFGHNTLAAAKPTVYTGSLEWVFGEKRVQKAVIDSPSVGFELPDVEGGLPLTIPIVGLSEAASVELAPGAPK